MAFGGGRWIKTSACNMHTHPSDRIHPPPPPAPPPRPYSLLQTLTCTCTQIEIVWAYLNKTSRKLDSGESSGVNAGLIKMDVFFFSSMVTVIPCKTQILGYMRRGRRRRSRLQPFLLLGKIALPWPPVWQRLYGAQWSTILGGRRFVVAPRLLNLRVSNPRFLRAGEWLLCVILS